jgi:SIR2-like domain
MDLLLVTGAGASHNLGQPDNPLPLMPEWANALCTALNDAEPGLANRCRLSEGMDSEQFEEALGELLRWEQMKYLNGTFAEMTDNPGPFREFDGSATRRLAVVRLAINQTLYAQFGQARVDDTRATEAYRKLLERFGGVERLVFATTNYDRSCEAALSSLGMHPDAGFRAADSESLPRLEVTNLVASAKEENRTACLHLHGAVGWYQEDGIVYDYKGSHDFNETLGAPVVLYPDPEKDPTSDAHVAALWDEFRLALSVTDHVLVLGHSLHDPALIKAIRDAKPSRVAVTFFASNEPENERAEVERIEQIFPGASVIGMEFGPELKSQSDGIDRFLS